MMVSAQETSRLIKGVVSDKSSGENLPGASITVKGTMRGAISNGDGEFTYLLNKNDIASAVLEINFIGYESQEIVVGNQSIFKIALKPTYNALNEVVVTSSYGTQKLKQDVVASISSIKPQDMIVEAAATSLDQLLEGQAAGLMIETGEGIDSPAEIHIRGVGSLPNSSVGTSTQPLIIVDGVILSEEIEIDGSFEFSDATYAEDPSNPLSKVGIKDIASINILKDAAAVSLYGADGANGVILITTKGGSPGKVKVSVGTQMGISTEMDGILYMDGQQYRETYNAYLESKGSPTNPWNGVSTDWFDLLNDNGFYQNYDFSISGGKNNFDFRISGAYQDIQESQIMNTMSRLTSNISLGYTKDKLKISWRISPSHSIKNSPNTLANFALPPDRDPYLSDGNYNKDFPSYGNPLAVANQNINATKILGLRNSLSLNYEIINGLSFSTLIGLDQSNKEQERFYSGENQSGIFNDGYGRRLINTREASSWNWNAVINYNYTLNEKHNFDATVGIETRLEKTEFEKTQGTGFAVYDSPQDNALANKVTYSADSDESTGRSAFTQLNYNYAKKYFILVNSRIDQSSAFGSDKNTSINSAIGLSWVMSNEAFLQDVRWIKHLKLRGSYGSSGNSRIGSYSAKGLYTLQDSEGSRGYNGNFDGYAYPESAPNPDLGWESNYKSDLGLDLITRYGINFTLELYNDDIRDMIVSRDVPLETGYSSVQINGANMYNRGLEFTVGYRIIDRENIKWNTSFNISTVKNEITSLVGLGSEESESYSSYATRVGTSSTAIWGYNFVGVDPSSGRELYNVGNGKIVDNVTFKNEYHNSNYREIIGNTQPDIYGGLSNHLTLFKNLSLRINMSYKIGGEKMVDDDKIDKYNIMSYSNMGVNAYYQAWRQPGDVTGYGAISERGTVTTSSKYLYSTSHIKLNSMNLSYRVPLKRKAFIKNLSLNATGSNLYYWFFEKSPEGQNGIKELYKTYPEMRSYTFGLNASF